MVYFANHHAFDVPDDDATFEGSRRQMRGRIVGVLGEYDELALDDLGPRVRVDYTPDGEHGREWLEGLLADLEADGLVETRAHDGETVARLRE
jgi:A/G-specific adenine glycosylase